MVLMIGMTTMRNQYTGRQLMVRLNSITCPYCTTPLEIETLSDGKQFLMDRLHFESTCPSFDVMPDDYIQEEPDPEYGWVTEWEDKDSE